MRQGVREHARAGHAPAHAQAVARVQLVRQDVQPAVAAAGPPAVAHWREAVRVRAVRQSVRRPVQPARAHDDALGRQELRVPLVPQDVRPQVVPEQAPGGRLRARRHRRARVTGGRVLAAAEAAVRATGRRRRITLRVAAAAAGVRPAHVGHTVRRRGRCRSDPVVRHRRLTARPCPLGTAGVHSTTTVTIQTNSLIIIVY